MRDRFRKEWGRMAIAARLLDRQTVFVLCTAALLVVIQFTFGDRQVFTERLASRFRPEWRGVLAWGWWFSFQGVTGFIIPAASLIFLFRRRPAEIGLGKGDWRLALTLAAAYLPLVVVGTWVLSDNAAFQAQYPHYSPAAHVWRFLIVYELFYVFYWMGWEYLWRGFVLFGTAHTFGVYSIFVQALPFVALHVQKPPAEAFLSILGGIALGALVWRCRSFWIAIPIHAFQMLALDLWCTLRLRSGVSGIGFASFADLIKHLGH